MTGGAVAKLVRAVRPGPIAVIAAGVAAITFHATLYLRYLPEADGTGGADYSYFLPQLLAGYYWFQHNGPLIVPWFTPAFCAGVPYYPNMQALYLSLPQFLTFVVGPAQALRITFVIFAAAGFMGFHLLLRRMFGVGRWIALAGGILFLFNTFYSARFIVGHLTFHAFMLTPIVAMCALAGARRAGPSRILDVPVLIGALSIGYMVQSGMVHALPPALLGVAAMILVHGHLFGFRWMPFARLIAMGAIALALSAAKLVAGMAYLSNFPREMIPLSGFGGLWQSLAVALQSLFVAPADVAGFLWLRNNQWFPDTKIRLAYHEFEYGVTIIPALIIVCWLTVRVVAVLRGRAAFPAALPRSGIALGMAFVLSLPIVLNWYQPTWTGVLESAPFFGSSSTLIRWISLYIPLVILVSMLVVERARGLARAHPYVALVIIVGVVSINAKLDRQYYERRGNYQFAAVEGAYTAVSRGAPVPAVGTVEWPRIDKRDLMSRRDRNEGLVRGATNPNCYEPMFGHRLEEYPYGPLRQGPTLEARNGVLNIKNPACMVYPEANQCRPGDHFTEDQIGEARNFVSYRPFRFQLPWWQTLANGISVVALFAVMAGIAVLGLGRRRASRRRRALSA